MRIIPPARVLRVVFVVAAVAWALMLPLAAYAASRPRAASVVYVFAAVVYAAGSLVCHQLPARSFHAWAVQMPVCARCTGIYAGAAIAVIISARLKPHFEFFGAALSRVEGLRAPHVSAGSGAYRWALVLSVMPTLATLVYEWTSGQMPGHWLRAGAGVPLGAVVAAVVVAAVDNQVN